MKIADINTNDIKNYLKFVDLENFFNIYKDKHGNLFFNLNNTIVFDTKTTTFPSQIINYDGYWPLISYKIYGTTRLAWILMKINNINAQNVFEKKYAGDKIYYIPVETVNENILTILGDN